MEHKLRTHLQDAIDIKKHEIDLTLKRLTEYKESLSNLEKSFSNISLYESYSSLISDIGWMGSNRTIELISILINNNISHQEFYDHVLYQWASGDTGDVTHCIRMWHYYLQYRQDAINLGNNHVVLELLPRDFGLANRASRTLCKENLTKINYVLSR